MSKKKKKNYLINENISKIYENEKPTNLRDFSSQKKKKKTNLRHYSSSFIYLVI